MYTQRIGVYRIRVADSFLPSRHAIANTLIGVVVFYCFGAAFLHFNGAWYGKYLPMSDSTTYDNTGHAYNTTRILTPQFTLNETEYENYSPLFIRLAHSSLPYRLPPAKYKTNMRFQTAAPPLPCHTGCHSLPSHLSLSTPSSTTARGSCRSTRAARVKSPIFT